MADVWPVLNVALEFSPAAGQISACYYNGSHHEHGNCNDVSQGHWKSIVTKFLLRLSLIVAAMSVAAIGILDLNQWVSVGDDHWI